MNLGQLDWLVISRFDTMSFDTSHIQVDSVDV